ncbi:hypothetical protein [Streptomyces liangshanensis]|uniref:Peptidase inhibitor family I36 protein n=1 Tax=Streptomyces liangshanensis TaxID=2717324 RepID=A0A6G9GWK8_9ACTN|nr:hypothetical protein [Streptomyces liangshanensis]QIQ02648.1 hypothetical protein HA039_10240 [Streptomyces liangshanensis]
MRLQRTVAGALVTAGLALGIAATGTTPAAADTAFGCGYPQVCFYKTQADWDARRWTAAYKDVTSYFQNLSSGAMGAKWVHNSRNDDGALLRFSSGTYCLQPGWSWQTAPGAAGPTGIRIMDSPTC